jgi:uncharacterized protein (DUF2236 family)
VGSLEVTDTARSIADAVFHPGLPRVTEPAVAAARFITIGMLPEPLRRQYGFSWDGTRSRLLHAGSRALGRVYPLVPRQLRHAPVLSF